MSKAKRAVVHIVESEIVMDGFRTAEGEYRMSQTDMAKAVKVPEILVRRFLKSQQLEHLPDKGFLVRQIEAETGFNHNGTINAVTLDAAYDFWFTQSCKGNKRAQALIYALGKETLQRRFDNAFEMQRTEQEYQQQTAVIYQGKWSDVRTYFKFTHRPFCLACKAYCFNAPTIHNLISVGVCGKTARELRLDELIGDDSKNGVDHIKNPDVIQAIADAKLNFSGMLTGSAQERVERALKLVLKGKKLQAS